MKKLAIAPLFPLGLLLAGCGGVNFEPEQSPAGARFVSTQPSGKGSAAERESAVLTNITQLTFGTKFARAGEAYFSHDMKWVIFQAAPKGEDNYQMYIARIAWGDTPHLSYPTRISPDGSRNTCGWFSEDGKTLIFASTAGKDDPDEGRAGYQRSGSRYRWAFSKGMEIYRVPNWENRVFIATDLLLHQVDKVDFAKPEFRLTNNDFYDAECVLTPNADWLIFCSDRPSGVPDSKDGMRAKNLWAMKLSDPTKLVQLTKTENYNGGPFVSPDGKHLVYRSDRSGNDLLQVYVADIVRDAQGNITGLANEHAVTNDGNVNWGPYWPPDGYHVLYATSKVSHGNYEIFMRNTDGGGEHRITFDPGPDVLPVVSPDGKWMMWASRRGADQTTQVYLARFKMPK